jgi:6-phosphogluconolactonase
MTRAARGGRSEVGVRVHDDLAALSRAAADALVAAAAAAVAARGRFVIALAGGETPRALYHELAERYGERAFWTATDVYFGDERCVPPNDAASNFGMARAELLSRVAVPEGRVHRIAGERRPPQEEAVAYDTLLRRELAGGGGAAAAAGRSGDATFDVALLGVGADGHTASLFPHDHEALDERARWALAVHAPPGVAPPERITLTLPVLNRARAVWVLAAGAGKASAVRLSLSDRDPVPPAGRVRGTAETVWFLDRAAAAELA